jgi:multicomponent Na+:H+ antiporter subunit A
MLLAVFSGFILAALAPLIVRFTRGLSGWVLALLPLSLFLYFASNLPQIAAGEVLTETLEWVPALGVNLTLRMDGLGVLMALIITGIGTLIYIYAGGYLHGDPLLGRFYLYLSIFMASMIGVALADNILMLFVFWELTSISSYLLIGFKHAYEDSRKSALRALVITGAGGLVMLAGFILLALAAGSTDISAMDSDLLKASGLYLPALILVAIGAFTKSAQFPFHSWLPGAMAAPTPVSAYLHSATMVKAGVFLLARMNPVLGDTPEWTALLVSVGLITVVLGAFLALLKTDLKAILAYSTVSSLGLMVALIGIGTKIAIESAVLFLLVHSLYKGALFLVAGTIDHATGTRDITKLGGLLRALPLIFVAAALAALSMSGMIPWLGFISKELTYEATLAYSFDTGLNLTATNALITALVVLGNMSAVMVGLLLAVAPFFGRKGDTPHEPHGASFPLWIGAVLLGLTSLALGVLPHIPSQYLISPAASSVYGEALTVKLSLWHGVTPMLILSLITIAGGVTLYALRARWQDALRRLDVGERIGPDRFIMGLILNLPNLSKQVTKFTQDGYLRHYIIYIMLTLVLFTGGIFLTQVDMLGAVSLSDLRPYELVISLVILGALALILRAKTMLTTIASMAVIGFSITILFVLYGAPDLAMTQFSIETLGVVLFVLMLYKLPGISVISSLRVRMRDALLATGVGGLITLFILSITAEPFESRLAEFFTANSYPEAQGRNIVNVILVDFRGFDTLGEITVLAVGAIGVFALLRLRPRQSETADDNTDVQATGTES